MSQSLLIQGRFQLREVILLAFFIPGSQSLLIQGRFQLKLNGSRLKRRLVFTVAIPSDSGQVSTQLEKAQKWVWDRGVVAIPSDSGQVSTQIEEWFGEKAREMGWSQSLLIQGRFQQGGGGGGEGYNIREGSQSLLIQGRFQLSFMLVVIAGLKLSRNPF